MNFQKVGLITLFILYLLIFVGGVVRSTGSGMGCPDWPKCFGRWIPPTVESELPLNYQEIFKAKLKGEVVFNVTKTWVEYLNRLLGVLTGFFVLATFLYSLKYRKTNSLVTTLSFAALILTIFQGWLGSKVVATELANNLVSIHMFVAIVIVLTLIAALMYSHQFSSSSNKSILKAIKLVIYTTIIVTVLQIVLGTQVRGEIDNIIIKFGESLRESWIDNLSATFIIHRSMSWVVICLNFYLYYLSKKDNTIPKIFPNALLGVILLGFLSGVGLNFLGFPAFLQPFHLTLAILSLGVLFSYLLFCNQQTKNFN